MKADTEVSEAKKKNMSKAHNDYLDFTNAVKTAQFTKFPYVEVTKELFDRLNDDPVSKYMTYGSPGIKVFVEGTRLEIEAEEKNSAEAQHEINIRRMKA